ncbi:MAG: hypothetical protein IKP19_03945 [Oscillospiraceae bacterium]|nr:hypothetical protein [Oscillospiraceae bacterium]
MTEKLVQLLQLQYPLEVCDPGAFSTLKAKGMRFTVRAWEARGLGHVSVMEAKGFFGLMKMDTLIVNPTERDLPLYSYDRIQAMGNDTLIAELYDTTVGGFRAPALDAVCADGAALPDRDPGTHWYDGLRLSQSISKIGKKAQREALDSLAAAHFSAWLTAECPPLTDKAAKQAKTDAYVEGLLTHGGPSTDVFLKTLGREQTEQLFRRVLFGTR